MQVTYLRPEPLTTEVPALRAFLEFLDESNRIEGVYDGDSVTQAMYAWEYLQSEKKLTGGVILKLHKILMLHQKLLPNQRGYWRTEQVGVYKGGQLIRECLDYRKIPDAIKQWLYVESKAPTADYPEEWVKQSHIQYELIHPFIDGNGRTGRMLLNWRRLQLGLPLLIVEEEFKALYYEWFNLPTA